VASLTQRLRQRVSTRGVRFEAPTLCEHLLAAPVDAVPKTPDGCGACIAQGTSWVDLRLCLTCGEVGCCDSSPWKHASRHVASTGHPVVRSFERGESWRWCYFDDMLG
jgi:uncharacterized UBP type Zn finger protein